MSSPAPANPGIAVRVRGLRKAFGAQQILDGIDLAIEPGEIFVLMGPSGAGKSVFLRHLIGLESADAGEIFLNDVSISRSTISWGIPLPWDPDHVIYVWFDALFNYYTALGYAREGEDLTPVFWPASWHILAKDILKFHAVFWPAFLIAAGIEPPERMFVHGYLLMDEKKMSKSLGNVLDPFEVIDRYGSDALRFYCFREVSFGQDGNISTPGFEARYESELANDFGNLASRTLSMVARYRESVVPEAEAEPVLA